MSTVKLHIRLQPGRRVVATLWPGRSEATVLEHFTGTDVWDWYHIALDAAPGLRHQARRDALVPLKTAKRKPLMGPIPMLS